MWYLWGVFLYTSLRLSRRRFLQELDDHSVAAIELKETQAGVLVLARESKKEGVHGLGTCMWLCQ